MKKFYFVLLMALVVGVGFGLIPPQEAKAWPDTPGGFEKSFTVSCPATANGARITPTSYVGKMFSYTCQNVSTTIVGVGSVDLADPDIATRTSPVHCATNCPSQEWGGNSQSAYCRADTGTVTIYCRGLFGKAF